MRKCIGLPPISKGSCSTWGLVQEICGLLLGSADNGGYVVETVARKELEDLERPVRATAAASFFLEQHLIDRLKRCM